MSEVPPLSRPGYEPKDASPGVIAATAGVLAGIVGIGLLVGLLIFRHGAGKISAEIGGGFQHGPEARTSIEETWTAMELASRDSPDGYGWVDRQAGIVRVPIARAMELVCAEQKSPAGQKEAPAP